jgi:hypothetical protein
MKALLTGMFYVECFDSERRCALSFSAEFSEVYTDVRDIADVR